MGHRRGAPEAPGVWEAWGGALVPWGCFLERALPIQAPERCTWARPAGSRGDWRLKSRSVLRTFAPWSPGALPRATHLHFII